MPGQGQDGRLRCSELSLLFRRRYWTAHTDEPDAGLLWPGARAGLSQWLGGEAPRVFGAVADGPPPRVASRVMFTRSKTRREVWYYGNFSTHPDFRRQGLGERVLAAGLAALARDGAHGCGCFIAQNNQASARLALKLGFQRLPVVRLALAANPTAATPAAAGPLIPVHPSGVDDHPRWLPLLLSLGMAATAASAVLADELMRPRPLLPWRQNPDHLWMAPCADGRAGFVRVGTNAVVVVLGAGIAGPDLDHLLVSVRATAGPQRPLFIFGGSQDLVGWPARPHPARTFDIFWKALV